MSATPSPQTATSAVSPKERTPGLSLLVIATAQLMLVLDDAIANIAVQMLIVSRGLQGLGAALVAPNALALITTTFPVGPPRSRAMAVYGAMSALGITVGVLLGGVLVGLLNWRWVFFINVPIGLAVLLGTRALVEGQRNRGRLDTVDALSGTGVMFALAYGITRGGEHGWDDALTVAAFIAALVLGGLFVALQAHRANPMLPARASRAVTPRPAMAKSRMEMAAGAVPRRIPRIELFTRFSLE